MGIRPAVVAWGVCFALCVFLFAQARALDNPKMGRLALVSGAIVVYAMRREATRPG